MRYLRALVLLLFFIQLLMGCSSPQATQALVTITIHADGQNSQFQLPAGSTVQKALDAGEISLNELDRTDPPVYTLLSEGAEVRIMRVTETFEVEEVVIPFTIQTLRNESLPKDKEILIQSGKNGLEEITYRRVIEDGVDVSSQPIPIKSLIVEEPVPEIRMIGIQSPFAPVVIPGKLIYLRDGNAWLVEDTTSNRKAVVTTGDLDGRVFSLSPDENWLLFTRRSTQEDQINSLWVARVGDEGQETPEAEISEPELIDLEVANVLHFADWTPPPDNKIVFSTVEPRVTAPGWQANNDLNAISLSAAGWTSQWSVIQEPNSGGVYGWWGTDFIWGPEQNYLTYVRPDRVGLLNYKDGESKRLFDILPLQTRGDWAWVPGITWGPDGKVLYAVNHVHSAGAISPEESPLFDLVAIPLDPGPSLPLASRTGMFAYPLSSPVAGSSPNDSGYLIAFLQAIFPEQSETSHYRLAVMDRDGSNRRLIFPPEESAGLQPQRNWGAWSPAALPESGNFALAVLYQGNVWFVDSASGEAVQITGDGLTNRILWK